MFLKEMRILLFSNCSLYHCIFLISFSIAQYLSSFHHTSLQNKMWANYYSCLCICAQKSFVFIYLFFVGFERNPHIIYKFLIFYSIFHGMLKWNHSNAGCKKPLESGVSLTSGSVDQVMRAWHSKMWNSPWTECL